VLEINGFLSLTCLISTGAPWLHTPHQWRSVLFSRVLVPQLSQTKTSFFMRHHWPVRKVEQFATTYKLLGGGRAISREPQSIGFCKSLRTISTGCAALISSLRTAQIQCEIHVPFLNYSCLRVDYHSDPVRVLGEKRARGQIGVSLNVRRNVRPKSVRRLMAVNDSSLPLLNVASTKPAPAMSRTCRSACRSRIRRKPCRCWLLPRFPHRMIACK
jgi:hypothetical protein